MHNLTRREALQKGGAVAGGVTLGGTAVIGNATADHGRTGGTMIVEGEPQTSQQKSRPSDPPSPSGSFSYTYTFGYDLPASCFASERELENYRTLEIEYRDGVRQNGAIRDNKKHMAEGTRYVFTSARECTEPEFEGMWKASFRPA